MLYTLCILECLEFTSYVDPVVDFLYVIDTTICTWSVYISPHSHTLSHTLSHTHTLSLPTRLNRTERAGRMHKHIADLNLLCGKLQPACDNFTEALLHLHDPLWRGSANEGLGATLVMKEKLDELLGQRTPPLLIQSNLIGGFLKVVSAKITGPRISLKPSVSILVCESGRPD